MHSRFGWHGLEKKHMCGERFMSVWVTTVLEFIFNAWINGWKREIYSPYGFFSLASSMRQKFNAAHQIVHTYYIVSCCYMKHIHSSNEANTSYLNDSLITMRDTVSCIQYCTRAQSINSGCWYKREKKIQDIEMENTWKSYFPSFSFNKYIFLLKIRTIIDCCLEKFDKKIEEDWIFE